MLMPPLIDYDPLSDSESDDEGSAHHAGEGSEDADATRRRPARKSKKKTYWNVSSIEEKIRPAEYANRNFLRMYLLRTDEKSTGNMGDATPRDTM